MQVNEQQSNVVELPLTTITVYGVVSNAMIPLVTLKLTDASVRDQVVFTLLTQLSENEKLIIDNTLIFTEKYDAFRVL